MRARERASKDEQERARAGELKEGAGVVRTCAAFCICALAHVRPITLSLGGVVRVFPLFARFGFGFLAELLAPPCYGLAFAWS